MSTIQTFDPFDPANFAVSPEALCSMQPDTGVTPVLTGIKVDKPHKQSFVRVHPDHRYAIVAPVHFNEATRRNYLVMRQIAAQMERGFAPTRELRLGQTRQGTLFIWPVPVLDQDDKRPSQWHISHREVMTVAQSKWVRMSADSASERYQYAVASIAAEPIWPDTPFRDILELAFGREGIIGDASHPVYRQLAGLE